MAAQLLALYGAPTDPAAFEAHYFGTHVPLAKKMPGLRSYTVNKGALSAGDGKPPYFLLAILEFDSMEALGAAAGSPEGQAAVADVPTFATGGCTILTYETQTV
jgi:uncharacterized protein (TIGR02118 family)